MIRAKTEIMELELFDKYFKAAMIKMLQITVMNMLEINKKIESLREKNKQT